MVMIGINQHIYHSWWPQMVTTRFQSNIKYLVATDGNDWYQWL